MNEDRKFDGVLNEENRNVISDEIPVAFLRINLNGESAYVACEVDGTLASGNGREADESRRALALALEYVRACDVGQRIGDFEEAMRAVTAGMNDALGDSLVVEMEEFLAQMEVFEKRWAAMTGAQRVLIVRDRNALLGCERGYVGARNLMGFATSALRRIV